MSKEARIAAKKQLKKKEAELSKKADVSRDALCASSNRRHWACSLTLRTQCRPYAIYTRVAGTGW